MVAKKKKKQESKKIKIKMKNYFLLNIKWNKIRRVSSSYSRVLFENWTARAIY